VGAVLDRFRRVAGTRAEADDAGGAAAAVVDQPSSIARGLSAVGCRLSATAGCAERLRGQVHTQPKSVRKAS
jgi:hypothetical protein